MSVFTYDPDKARVWASEVLNFMDGGAESVNACSRKFNEQIEHLVQPNVWTGPAAMKNYNDFMETHNSLVTFINSFGDAFETAMQSVNKSVSELESVNAGGNTNDINSTFGSLSFSQLGAMSEQNINTDVVRYDYNTITQIGEELSKIYTGLENVNSNLTRKIEVLNNGDAIWDGDAAESAKANLSSTLKNNMDKVMANLNVCIQNISTAAESAANADKA